MIGTCAHCVKYERPVARVEPDAVDLAGELERLSKP